MQAAIIEEELGRVLQSKTFSRASRLRKFLEYIVQEQLAGNGGQLKEYQIGVAVFERGGSFDPCIDTIVRVEAIKLRARLDAYFEDEGATEPVRISIPKGSYRPVFELRDDPPTPILDDPEALYWQAKSLGKNPDELQRALRLLSLGVRRWPSNAGLHVRLAAAAAGATCGEIGFLAPREGLRLMQRAARRALELDPDQGEAYFFGKLADLRLADKSAVFAAMRHALSLSPKNAGLHHWAAAILLADGRSNEALLHARQAERLAPGVLAHKTRTAMVLFYTGKYGLSIGYLRDILEFAPDNYLANLYFSRALCSARRIDEARDCASRAHAVTGATNALAALGYVEARAGNTAAADKIAAELESCAKERYVRPSGLAAINIALGRMDAAARHLSTAVREGDFILGWAKMDRRWDPLRKCVAGL
jgi:tetratricopeptide (TPR) repeat protein